MTSNTLHTLLPQLFDDATLRRFVYLHPSLSDLSDDLPGQGASVNALVDVFVAELRRRDRIEPLINLLCDEFPCRAAEIRGVERPLATPRLGIPRPAASRWQALSLDELRTRLEILRRVRSHWADAAPSDELDRVPIDLAIRPVLVAHAAAGTAAMPARPGHAGICHAYTESGGNLLVLGAPGAGKTTALLRLARALLDEAERDEWFRIPIVLNLSTWRPGRALFDWLADELGAGFALPRALVVSWVDAGRVALLLDGLDEIPRPHRACCVNAIEAFRRITLTPVSVATRTGPYLELDRRLALEGAVEMQELSDEVIARRLASHPKGAPLRALAANDWMIRWMTRSPLLLEMLIVVVDELIPRYASGGDPKRQRMEVCRFYVQTMLDRRSSTRFDRADIGRWLGHLARAMEDHGTSECRIERVQSSWLRRPYERHAFILLSLVFVGVVACFTEDMVLAIHWALSRYLGTAPDAAPEPVSMLIELFSTLPVPICLLLRGELRIIAVHERLAWSWRAWWSRFTHLGFWTAAACLVVGIVWTVIPEPGIDTTSAPWRSVAVVAVFVGICFAPIGGIVPATTVGDTSPRAWYTTLIRHALVNTSAALVPFLALVAAVLLADIEPDSRRLVIDFLLLLGLYVAHIVLYLRGGFALVQHAVLRFLLAATGALPWHLRSLLDECADRDILRRVGAGYMFRHHLLQESLGTAVAPAWSTLTDR